MCGIAGIFNYRNYAPVDGAVIQDMTDVIRHRGPDSHGVYINGAVGLGFTRLSIVDLVGGSQPMHSIDGRYSLIFNGEIYNYKELRSMMIRKGYQFRTQSDTEVILGLFELHDPLPEARLHGMFAFALYDARERQLILSRDRLGKKPLFWSLTDEGVVFGSEVKSLLRVSGVKRQPRWHVISDFLTLGYCPGLESPFEDIYHVSPGGRIIIKDAVEERVWWTLPSRREMEKSQADDWADRVLESLKQSVKYRLIADAPLGIFLSGGLDSALILSLVCELGVPEKFIAYTVGFNSATFDESNAASALAQRAGVEHVPVLMKPQDIERIFEDVVYKSDGLIANPAIFANYLLSEVASKNVKAVLHGGGGDELFFGYETYRADVLSGFLERIPPWLFRCLMLLLEPVPTSYRRLGFKYKATKFLEGMKYPKLKRHYWWRTIFTEEEKDCLLERGIPRRDSFHTYEDAYACFQGDDFYEHIAFADMQVWWKGMGLYQGDSMSMANALELRMPFMDQSLLQLMSEIPRQIKFNNYKLKALFKQVCQSYLPRDVLNRPKIGFHIPLGEWFAGPLKAFLEDRLAPERVKHVPGLVVPAVQKVIQDHHERRFDNSFKLINLLVLVEWYRRFIQN